MVDYMAALKRPFSDLKAFIIGAIVGIIPIVNLAFTGYLLDCAATASRRDYRLPEWTNWGRLFVRGIMAFIIAIIYYIPVAIVVVFFALLGMAVKSAVVPLIGLLFVLLVALIIGLMLPMALVSYAIHDDIKAAFSNEVVRRVFTGKYIVAWIIVAIVSSILLLLALIPFIGIMVALVVIGVFGNTVYGTLYSEL
ncbi:MAG: DUF4013 domain-containing protein [Candidatus Diapherotrites archaeon]|nr:DUF4013 domain-containing protein [Candidatus Diapherotrites archaeon]